MPRIFLLILLLAVAAASDPVEGCLKLDYSLELR